MKRKNLLYCFALAVFLIYFGINIDFPQALASKSPWAIIDEQAGSFDTKCLSPLKNDVNCTDTDASGNSTAQAKSTITSIPGLFGKIIDILLISISSVALVSMMIGGFMMIMSGANQDLYGKGQKAATYSLIGIAVAFLSFLIVRFVDAFLK